MREVRPTDGPWAGNPRGKHLAWHASRRHTKNMTEPLEPSASEQGAYVRKPKPAVQCSMRCSPPGDFVHYTSHVQRVPRHRPHTATMKRSQTPGHVRRQGPTLAAIQQQINDQSLVRHAFGQRTNPPLLKEPRFERPESPRCLLNANVTIHVNRVDTPVSICKK